MRNNKQNSKYLPVASANDSGYVEEKPQENCVETLSQESVDDGYDDMLGALRAKFKKTQENNKRKLESEFKKRVLNVMSVSNGVVEEVKRENKEMWNQLVTDFQQFEQKEIALEKRMENSFHTLQKNIQQALFQIKKQKHQSRDIANDMKKIEDIYSREIDSQTFEFQKHIERRANANMLAGRDLNRTTHEESFNFGY